MAVTRTGGASSNFASATTSPQSIAFTLPGGTDYLVAMVSIYIDSSDVSALTWKPDSGDAGADQAMTLIGKYTAGSPGNVEIWGLANPTATVTGSVVEHSLDSASKRIMGIHALGGVDSVGTPVGTHTSGITSISVDVTSATDGLVLDVLFGQNSTATYTAGGGQTERWDTNTSGGLNNLRGCGSQETGAAGTVTMSWTVPATNVTVMGVSFNPPAVFDAATGPHTTPDLSHQDRWQWPTWYHPEDQQLTTESVDIYPDLLGGAQIFAPSSIDQEALPGPLGPAQLFSPTVGPAGVLPSLLGEGQVFAPGFATDQFISAPALLGGAVLFDPQGEITNPTAPQVLGGAIQDQLVARTHIWFQEGGSNQSPFIPPNQFVTIPLLGPSLIFDPRIDQEIRPTLLGPAVVYDPEVLAGQTVGPMDLLGGAQIFAPTTHLAVAIGLLGPATLYDPTIGAGQFVLPGLLGSAVLFAPTIISAQVISPSLLGPAVLFAPASIGGFTLVTGSFTADAYFDDLARHPHNRFTDHSGVDTDLDHLLALTIDAYYTKGFPLEELLREIDRRLTLLEDKSAQYRRVFGSFTADAVLKKAIESSFTADAYLVSTLLGDFTIGPMPRLGTAQIFAFRPPMPLLGPAVLRTPTRIAEFGVFLPATLGGAILRTPTISQFGVSPAKLGLGQIFTPTVKMAPSVAPPRLGKALLKTPTIT